MDVLSPNAAEALEVRQVRVLLVEDEILIRLFVSEMLRDVGYDVIEAVNGDEALEILSAGVPFDLVLSDVRMPGSTDGIALLSCINESRPDLPVIITSSDLDPKVALAAGAAQFLAKPFKVEDALSMIGTEVAKIR